MPKSILKKTNLSYELQFRPHKYPRKSSFKKQNKEFFYLFGYCFGSYYFPDFIANCGMARVFAYLMQSDIEISDEGIFTDISKTMENALREVYTRNKTKRNIAKTGFETALNQLI